jgi:dCTP diphosphatase
MPSIAKLQKQIEDFRRARDWTQFHTPKDVVLSLLIEAGELAEHFQFKSEAEARDYLRAAKSRRAVADELSDVLYWMLLLAIDANIDVAQAFARKMRHNARKYPVRKAKGRSTKYTRL